MRKLGIICSRFDVKRESYGDFYFLFGFRGDNIAKPL